MVVPVLKLAIARVSNGGSATVFVSGISPRTPLLHLPTWRPGAKSTWRPDGLSSLFRLGSECISIAFRFATVPERLTRKFFRISRPWRGAQAVSMKQPWNVHGVFME